MRFREHEASGRVGLHRRVGRARERLVAAAAVLSCVLLAGCTGRTKRPGDAADASPDAAEADVPCGPCGCAEREGMVCVPAGSFLMGDPDPEPVFPDAPLHEVVLSAYWIDRTEVTNDAYRGCV
ncbi:MAG: SUMF1/EgtB/PvdO family nonheme iron enzyme, partial [Gemmatimonadota bacterium]